MQTIGMASAPAISMLRQMSSGSKRGIGFASSRAPLWVAGAVWAAGCDADAAQGSAMDASVSKAALNLVTKSPLSSWCGRQSGAQALEYDRSGARNMIVLANSAQPMVSASIAPWRM
jgi:hypothetical protein